MPDTFGNTKTRKPHNPMVRATIEVGSILFLFYANLLMGEFTASSRVGKTFAFALRDIFTVRDFLIGIVCAFLGYVVFEYMRRRS